MMFSVDFLELVVIGVFQCAKPEHTPIFEKPARTGAEKEDVSGETRTYGNLNYVGLQGLYVIYNAYVCQSVSVGYAITKTLPTLISFAVHSAKKIELIEKIQDRFTKMIKIYGA